MVARCCWATTEFRDIFGQSPNINPKLSSRQPNNLDSTYTSTTLNTHAELQHKPTFNPSDVRV
eukprot:6170153-Alexandrium_andersonii.AAC.1